METHRIAARLVLGLVFTLTSLGLSSCSPRPVLPSDSHPIDRSESLGDQIRATRGQIDLYYLLWPYFEAEDPLGTLALSVALASDIDAPGDSLKVAPSATSGGTPFDHYRLRRMSMAFYALSFPDLRDHPAYAWVYEHRLLRRVERLNDWATLYPHEPLSRLCNLSLDQVHACYARLSGEGWIYSFEQMLAQDVEAFERGIPFDLIVPLATDWCDIDELFE